MTGPISLGPDYEGAGTPDLDELATPVFALWNQCKASRDYDEDLWVAYMTVLAEHSAKVARLRVELQQYETAAKLLRGLVMQQDENVPRGTQ